MTRQRRMSKDEYFLRMAWLAGQRATCPIRRVGAVIVDTNDFVLATGYNGRPPGEPHCIDGGTSACAEARGEGQCEAMHAEANALGQLLERDNNLPPMEVKLYLTCSPCQTCTDLFAEAVFHDYIVVRELHFLEPKGHWPRMAEHWANLGPGPVVLMAHVDLLRRLEAEERVLTNVDTLSRDDGIRTGVLDLTNNLG